MAVTQRQAPLFGAPDDAPGGGRRDHFGANLKHYRLVAGLTLDELADMTGTSAATLSRYETGKRRDPKRALVMALCSVLQLSYEQLIGPPALDLPPPSSTWPALYPRDGRLLRFVGQEGGAARLAAEASTERFVVQAIGDALAPHVREHDYLVMEIDRPPHIGDVVVLDVRGELHLRMVVQMTSARLYLTSKRGELVLPEAGVTLLGVVIDHARSLPSPAMDVGNPGPEHGVGAALPWELVLAGCDDDD